MAVQRKCSYRAICCPPGASLYESDAEGRAAARELLSIFGEVAITVPLGRRFPHLYSTRSWLRPDPLFIRWLNTGRVSS